MTTHTKKIREPNEKPILKIEDLSVTFKIKDKSSFILPKYHNLKAVNQVSLELYAGETLGVVGESGCGKSTLARAIIGLVKPTAGKMIWLGREIDHGKNSRSQRKQLANEMQMIFQDPVASLNPRMSIGQILSEPLIVHYPELKRDEIDKRVKEIMIKVGLMPDMIYRYPHEFSGGQAQRIGIARALILKPKLIICDEPVSALDVSIQAQVINLLKDIQQEMNLSLIFIAHDLSVVRHISDKVLVMYLGNECEIGTSDEVFDDTRHPYTKALISAIPIPDPEKERAKVVELLEGDLPSPISPPSGCVFRTRCPRATEHCSEKIPERKDFTADHQVYCLNV